MFSAFNKFGKLGSPAGSRSLLAQIQAMGASFIGIPSLSNYQDSAGTALVTQPGGGAADPPVGKVLDLSGLGNHATQSTSTARPKLSALVNLLTKTELPGGLTDWGTVGGSITAATLTGWRNGITTGAAFAPNAGFAYLFCDSHVYAAIAGVQYVFSCDVRMDDGGAPVFSATRSLNDFDICIAADLVPTANRTITHLGDGIYRVSGQMVAGAGNAGNNGIFVGSVDSATGRGFKVTAFEMNIGSTATRYQRVTDASNYDYSGFPLIHQFDAVDDAHVITFGSSLGSDCTVVTANRGTTPTIATAQTIGTSHTISATHAGKLIFNRALTAGETTIVTNWATALGALA